MGCGYQGGGSSPTHLWLGLIRKHLEQLQFMIVAHALPRKNNVIVSKKYASQELLAVTYVRDGLLAFE